jgi:hypothetical protein
VVVMVALLGPEDDVTRPASSVVIQGTSISIDV